MATAHTITIDVLDRLRQPEISHEFACRYSLAIATYERPSLTIAVAPRLGLWPPRALRNGEWDPLRVPRRHRALPGILRYQVFPSYASRVRRRVEHLQPTDWVYTNPRSFFAPETSASLVLEADASPLEIARAVYRVPELNRGYPRILYVTGDAPSSFP